MRTRGLVAAVVSVLWAGAAAAVSPYPDQPFDVRVTGMLLPVEERGREDLVAVEVDVEGQSWLLRLGRVEGRTRGERGRAVKYDFILLHQVRFYGAQDVIARLKKPEIVGKVLIMEGRLDTKKKRFLVRSVKEASGTRPASPRGD